MRILIIGGVAAGMSAAAKARRTNESAEIVVYDKDRYVSYSGCAMPYLLSGVVESMDSLVPREEKFFKSWYNIDVITRTEVISIDISAKKLKLRNLDNDKEYWDSYDKLIIATGAKPNILPIKGIDSPHVFYLRNINDIAKIKDYLYNNTVKNATIIGTGFIGLEVCENLTAIGINVTMIERLNQVTPNLDKDLAEYIEDHLKSKKVTLYKSANIEEITKEYVTLGDGTKVSSDFVLVSAGAKPDTTLAVMAGVELGITGAIKVDTTMRTTVPDVFACGDCAEQYNIITDKPIYRPLGSTANKMGRVAGANAAGGNKEFGGVLGTSIFKVFDMTAAQTGLTAQDAQEQGYDIEVAYNFKNDRPDIMGGSDMLIKSVADRTTGRLLGVQIVGYEGVDKRIDVFATAITLKATVAELGQLDLAYAPPFSTAKDPVIYQGMIHTNSIEDRRKIITPEALNDLINSKANYVLIDVRSAGQFARQHIKTSINIPLAQLRSRLNELDKTAKIIVSCNTGVTSNAAQNVLINNGFNDVSNLTGGATHYFTAKYDQQLKN